MKIHQYSAVCIVLTLTHVVLMFLGLTEAQDEPCDIAQAYQIIILAQETSTVIDLLQLFFFFLLFFFFSAFFTCVIMLYMSVLKTMYYVHV